MFYWAQLSLNAAVRTVWAEYYYRQLTQNFIDVTMALKITCLLLSVVVKMNCLLMSSSSLYVSVFHSPPVPPCLQRRVEYRPLPDLLCVTSPCGPKCILCIKLNWSESSLDLNLNIKHSVAVYWPLTATSTRSPSVFCCCAEYKWVSDVAHIWLLYMSVITHKTQWLNLMMLFRTGKPSFLTWGLSWSNDELVLVLKEWDYTMLCILNKRF